MLPLEILFAKKKNQKNRTPVVLQLVFFSPHFAHGRLRLSRSVSCMVDIFLIPFDSQSRERMCRLLPGLSHLRVPELPLLGSSANFSAR